MTKHMAANLLIIGSNFQTLRYSIGQTNKNLGQADCWAVAQPYV